jgi:hypothetical protein
MNVLYALYVDYIAVVSLQVLFIKFDPVWSEFVKAQADVLYVAFFIDCF